MSAPTHDHVKQYAAKIAKNSGIANPDEKALHIYLDTGGTPLYWRVRVKNTITGDKWIRPFYWNGEAFVMGEPPAPPEGKPLYGLERLARYPEAVVIVTEGENSADALNKALTSSEVTSVLALTSGGASSAQAANWAYLTGRHAVIFRDNDEAGEKYQADVIECLRMIAASVRVIDIAALNLTNKGDDAVDYFKAGGTINALMLAIEPVKPITENAVALGCDPSPAIDAVEAIPYPESAAKPDTPPAQTDDKKIKWLASLKPLEYDRVRKEQAKLMNCRPAVLDALVKAARSEGGEADRLPFAEIEPHPEPIDPAILLSDVVNLIRQFIVLETEQATASALWVALTWFIDVVQVAPLLVITAPEMACGKSQLRDLLSRIVMRPLSTNNMKAATLFRIAEKWHPSLMLDEVDLMLKSDDEIINLVNAGHHRGASQVWRLVGDNHEPKSFDVWGAKCFAGIALEKIIPASTLSRAIIIKLRRKLSHESVSRMRHADGDIFISIAEKLARFAVDYAHQVKQARPVLPEVLSDRDQDNWECLLAIASCAGAEWLARATAAALKLSGAAEKTVSMGNELLADIQHIFETKRVDKISTADLIAALCADEEAAWATWNRGKQLSPRQLSRQLAGYSIASKNIRLGYEISKGFELSQFADAFMRYLSTPLNLPLHPLQTPEANKHGAISVADNPLQKDIRNNSATPEAPPLLDCSGVADKKPILGGAGPSRPTTSHLRI